MMRQDRFTERAQEVPVASQELVRTLTLTLSLEGEGGVRVARQVTPSTTREKMR